MSGTGLTRREFLATTSAVAAAGSLPAWAQDKPASITVTAYGGIWEKALRESFAECFKKKTGVGVTVMLGNSAQWMAKVQASPQKPPLAILINDPIGAFKAMELGLVEPITPDKVPTLREIPAKFYEPWRSHGVAINFGNVGLGYSKKTVKNPPKGWKDFVEGAIRGDYKVTLPSITYPFTPLMTLWPIANAYGGSVERIDIAFEKIKAMKKNVVKFWADAVEHLQLMETGEADIGPYWDGRAWAYQIDKGADWYGFHYPEPGGVTSGVIIQKVKNTPDIAWQFIDCALTAEAQSTFANTVWYPATNPNTKYPAKIQPVLPKPGETVIPPFEELHKRTAALVERWNKEIGG